MKKRGLALFLLVVMLASVCAAALADETGGHSPIRFRNGKAYTLYAAPSMDAAVIGTLPARTVFTVAFFTSVYGTTWACIVLENGTSGFITSGGKMVANLRMIVE